MDSPLLGIGEAAKLLGLSKTSLQKLVDAGKIPAVRTAGGHRRLAREAVTSVNLQSGPLALLGHSSHRSIGQRNHAAGALTVLLVEDDSVTAALFSSFFQDLFPTVNLVLAKDGLSAILSLERVRPEVLITDLNMEPFDGFKLLQLLAQRSEFEATALVAVSSLSEREIAARGGLPQRVLFLEKPVDLPRLRGFVDAHVQLKFTNSLNHSFVSLKAQEALPA